MERRKNSDRTKLLVQRERQNYEDKENNVQIGLVEMANGGLHVPPTTKIFFDFKMFIELKHFIND